MERANHTPVSLAKREHILICFLVLKKECPLDRYSVEKRPYHAMLQRGIGFLIKFNYGMQAVTYALDHN